MLDQQVDTTFFVYYIQSDNENVQVSIQYARNQFFLGLLKPNKKIFKVLMFTFAL